MHGAVYGTIVGRVGLCLHLDKDEAHVEVEREGRDEIERAGGRGEHRAGQVHARDQRDLHVPILQGRHARTDGQVAHWAR